jgi:hypothetical protein
MRGRGHYVEAGATTENAVKGLRCVNELVLVVATQLDSDIRRDPAYPTEALWVVLEDKANSGGCIGDLQLAARASLERTRPDAPDP